MAEINLTQMEADSLMSMEKHRADEEHAYFPDKGRKVAIPLQSPDRREQFILDLRQGRIGMQKITMQNRARQVVVLARLDLGGAPRRNPDGEEIALPHLHTYREGYGDKWAVPAPTDIFKDLGDIWQTLDDFMRFCNITKPPHIQQGLFS